MYRPEEEILSLQICSPGLGTWNGEAYDAFFLVLKNLNYAQGNEKGNVKGNVKRNETNKIKGTGKNVSERAEMIAGYLKSHPHATIVTMSEEFSLTRKQIVSALELLKNQNRVQYKGASRNGHWEVISYPLPVKVDGAYTKKCIDDILFSLGKGCIGIVPRAVVLQHEDADQPQGSVSFQTQYPHAQTGISSAFFYS